MREGQGQEASKQRIPSIREWVQALESKPGFGDTPHSMAVRLARLAAHLLRSGKANNMDEALNGVLVPCLFPGPGKVINATGVLLHTNLGRAPLDRDVVIRALDRVTGYTDLEMDLERGKRGRRDRHFAELARLVWDTEDALIVNNAAAAIALSLAALASGRETLVSRGELIEIGGSFRLPDVMTFAGTLLREVGTTNKTKLGDFAAAISSETACLFKTHLSNYRIEGFTQSVTLAEMVGLGQSRDLPVIMDLGSGYTRFLATQGVHEPTVEQSLSSGADLVIFSGDKLFGSIQAGIILGKKTWIKRLRCHSMMRMVRADKLTIAILCQHLAEMVRGRKTQLQVLLDTDGSALYKRAAQIQQHLDHPFVEVVAEPGFVGGGSLPGQERESAAVVVSCPKPDHLAAILRASETPIVPHIKGGALRLNLATVFPSQDSLITRALQTYLL